MRAVVHEAELGIGLEIIRKIVVRDEPCGVAIVLACDINVRLRVKQRRADSLQPILSRDKRTPESTLYGPLLAFGPVSGWKPIRLRRTETGCAVKTCVRRQLAGAEIAIATSHRIGMQVAEVRRDIAGAVGKSSILREH